MKSISACLLSVMTVIVLFTSCEPKPGESIHVKYNVGKDASGATVISANIHNAGGNALTNIGIDFSTSSDHRIVRYMFTGVVCEGQNVDVVVVPDFEVDAVEKAEVTESEVTICNFGL